MYDRSQHLKIICSHKWHAEKKNGVIQKNRKTFSDISQKFENFKIICNHR